MNKSTLSGGGGGGGEDAEEAARVREQLKEQLAYFRVMRQGLEKARLLMELIRKREKQKREMLRIDELITQYELNATNGVFLRRLLAILVELDKNEIFARPVDAAEVPSYYDEIKQPMDFSHMCAKLDRMAYARFDEFDADFQLIIKNCLTFNPKNTFHYKAALKLREQVIRNRERNSNASLSCFFLLILVCSLIDFNNILWWWWWWW